MKKTLEHHRLETPTDWQADLGARGNFQRDLRGLLGTDVPMNHVFVSDVPMTREQRAVMIEQGILTRLDFNGRIIVAFAFHENTLYIAEVLLALDHNQRRSLTLGVMPRTLAAQGIDIDALGAIVPVPKTSAGHSYSVPLVPLVGWRR